MGWNLFYWTTLPNLSAIVSEEQLKVFLVGYKIYILFFELRLGYHLVITERRNYMRTLTTRLGIDRTFAYHTKLLGRLAMLKASYLLKDRMRRPDLCGGIAVILVANYPRCEKEHTNTHARNMCGLLARRNH